MGIFDTTGLSQPGTGMLGNPLAGQGVLTGSSNPWLALIGQALRGGLAGVAAGRGTRGFGAGLGVGSVAGVQSGYEAEANKRRNQALQQQIDYQNSEIQLRQQAAAEKEAERQRTEAFISSLPPEQQGMARLAPKEVIAQQLKQMYPDDAAAPKTRDVRIGTSLVTQEWDPKARAWNEVGRGPAWAPPNSTTIRMAEPPVEVMGPDGKPIYVTRAQALGQSPYHPAPAGPDSRSQEERYLAYLNDPTSDPNSPEYAAKFYQLYMTPKMVQTENGMVPVMPAVPPGIRKPGVPTAAGGSGFTVGAPLPGTKPAEKAPTESQGLAAGFALRMQRAEALLDQISKTGTDSSNRMQGILGGVPLGLGKGLQDPNYQRYMQAAQDWVRAKLRKESGAAIGEKEMADEIATYFPQPGETDPAVLEQKRLARATALDAMNLQVKPGKASGGAPSPTTEQEYNALPAGSMYHHPDDPPGVLRQKQ